MTKSGKQHGHAALFTANMVFGLNTPLTRTLVPDILDPFAMTFLRMIGAAILFWMASIFAKKERVPLKDIVLFFFAALFAIVINPDYAIGTFWFRFMGKSHSPMNHFRRFLVSAIFSLSVSPALSKYAPMVKVR